MLELASERIPNSNLDDMTRDNGFISGNQKDKETHAKFLLALVIQYCFVLKAEGS